MERKPVVTLRLACALALAGLLAIALAGCPKKDSAQGEAPRAVAGPVKVQPAGELPEGVLGWAAIGDLRGLLERTENLVGQAAPIAPGTLAGMVAQTLARAGLKDPGALELGAPLAVAFLDPKRFPLGPLAAAFTTRGQVALLEALSPTWKKAGEAEGVLELVREELDPYGVFEAGGQKAQPRKRSLFLRFHGPVALVGPSREALALAGPGLLERIARSAPAAGLVVSLRLDQLRKAFQAELAMWPVMARQQMQADLQGQALGGVSPEQALFLAGWILDKGFSALGQIREAGLAVSLTPEAAQFTLGFQPEQGSFFQGLLAAQKPSAGNLQTYLGSLPEDAFLACALDVQWKLFQDDLLAFGEEIFKTFYGPEPPAEIPGLMREFMELLGEQLVLSESFSPQGGLEVVEVFAVRDAPRFQKLVGAMMALVGEHLLKGDLLPQAGFRMSLEGPRDLGKHGDIALQGFDFVLDLTGLPAPQAEAIRMVYGGDRMRLGLAAWDGRAAIVIGPELEADLKSLLERSGRPAQGGLVSTPAFRSAAGGLEQGAGAWFYLSMTRMLAWTMRSAQATLGTPGAPLPEPAPARSGVFFRVGQANGRLELTTRLPAEHLKELGESIRSLAQASGPQAPGSAGPAR
jgi:hypothetical protein